MDKILPNAKLHAVNEGPLFFPVLESKQEPSAEANEARLRYVNTNAFRHKYDP